MLSSHPELEQARNELCRGRLSWLFQAFGNVMQQHAALGCLVVPAHEQPARRGLDDHGYPVQVGVAGVEDMAAHPGIAGFDVVAHTDVVAQNLSNAPTRSFATSWATRPSI